MRNGFIDNIINNFAEQYRICEKMAACAQEQLNLLQGPNQEDTSSQVMDIMLKRQGLLNDLQLLDAENKSLQERVLAELEINEFTLSQLEDKLEPEQYANFKEMLNRLGTIFKAISEIDRQNQLLMRDGLARGSKSSTRTSNKEASNAYQQIMRLNKDNP